MEHLLFVPSTRLHDRIENGDERLSGYIGISFSEVELTARGQDFVMNGRCTWKQFTEALGTKIVWVGERAYLDVCKYHDFLAFSMNYGEDGHVLSVNADIESTDKILADVWADSIAQAFKAIHLLCRLLTTSGARVVEFDSTVNNRDICPFSGLALSQLLQQCPSLVQLRLKLFALDEEIVRALWVGAGTNIEIVLDSCTTMLSGTNALIESLRLNRGPTQLLWCGIPTEVFATGLRGNTNVKILKLYPRSHRDPLITDGDIRNLVQSLSQNQGLLQLDFGQHYICDDNWDMLCQSIARHPALERMDVTRESGEYIQAFSELQKTERTEMLAEMLKVNTVLHNITLTPQDYNQRILSDEILPRLLVNKYRPRVRALRTQNNDNFLRAKLLGRALHSVNVHPTIIWIFLTSHKDHLMRGVQG
jgi:hypothetical protein